MLPNRIYELLIFHEIREGAESLDTADSADDTLYRVIEESCFKVGSSCFWVLHYEVRTHKSVFGENRFETESAEHFYTQFLFVSAVRLTEYTARKTYNSDLIAFFQWGRGYHSGVPSLSVACFHIAVDLAVCVALCDIGTFVVELFALTQSHLHFHS